MVNKRRQKNEKKYFVLILAFLLNINIVNAESGYVPGKNIYVGSDGAKSVIIYKGTDTTNVTSEDIYYVDQSKSAEGFSNLEMAMKLDAPAGVYTVVVNGGNKTIFTISEAEASVSGASEVAFLGAQKKSESSYSAAFGIIITDLRANVSTLTLLMNDKAYITDLFGENSIINWKSGTAHIEDGCFMIAIQIDGIGTDYFTEENGTVVPNFKLYVK